MTRLLKTPKSSCEVLDLSRKLSQPRLLCASLASFSMVQRPIGLLPSALAAMLLGAACHQIGSATGERVKQGVVGSADRRRNSAWRGRSLRLPTTPMATDGQAIRRPDVGQRGLRNRLLVLQSIRLADKPLGRKAGIPEVFGTGPQKSGKCRGQITGSTSVSSRQASWSLRMVLRSRGSHRCRRSGNLRPSGLPARP